MKKIGFAITSSFCTIKEVMPQIKLLKEMGYDVIPIASPKLLEYALIKPKLFILLNAFLYFNSRIICVLLIILNTSTVFFITYTHYIIS